jgi:hypothetical protein
MTDCASIITNDDIFPISKIPTVPLHHRFKHHQHRQKLCEEIFLELFSPLNPSMISAWPCHPGSWRYKQKHSQFPTFKIPINILYLCSKSSKSTVRTVCKSVPRPLEYAKSDNGLRLMLGLLVVELDREMVSIPPAKESCHIDFLLYYHSNLQLETRMR